MNSSRPKIAAIDIFCGAGGLSYGLQAAGISVVGGIDFDPACRYPFEKNIDAPFLLRDVRDITANHLNALWPQDSFRLLAGCAPCQPFSPHRRGVDTSAEAEWALLGEFARLVEATVPDFLTMENVPRIAKTKVFLAFVRRVEAAGYTADWKSCYGPAYGLAQGRRRLVLIAARHGDIEVPKGRLTADAYKTVRDRIGRLPAVAAGARDPRDRLHQARSLSETNLKRIRASKPGGTWEDWPAELRAPCHRKKSGATFRNVYARMEWDQPGPTITTLAHNFGTGRFGHPAQDRPITLREAAMLQGFPRRYRFVPPREPVSFQTLGRLIGNAVPPPLAKAVGRAIVAHAKAQVASTAA